MSLPPLRLTAKLCWDGDNFSTQSIPYKKSTLQYTDNAYTGSAVTYTYPATATVVDSDWGRYFDDTANTTRSITKADVLSSNFGVCLLPYADSTLNGLTYKVDYVAIKVTWADGGGVRGVAGIGSNSDFKCVGDINCDGAINVVGNIYSSTGILAAESASLSGDISCSTLRPLGDIRFNTALAYDGGIYVPYTNEAAGSTGNKTIDRMSGRVRVAAAGTSVTVTNSLVTTASRVFANCSTNDATAWVMNVVPAAGSFTINLGAAATAETAIDWWVLN